MEELRRQETDSCGKALEKMLLPGLLMEEEKPQTILRKHLKQDAAALNDFDVPKKLAHNVICIDAQGDINGMIDWLKKSIKVKLLPTTPLALSSARICSFVCGTKKLLKTFSLAHCNQSALPKQTINKTHFGHWFLG